MNVKTEYTIAGQVYKIVLQRNNLVLYHTAKRDLYELLKLRISRKDYTVPSGSKVLKGDTLYPSTNEWGDYGWSYKTKQDALDKIAKLESIPPPVAVSCVYPKRTSSLNQKPVHL